MCACMNLNMTLDEIEEAAYRHLPVMFDNGLTQLHAVRIAELHKVYREDGSIGWQAALLDQNRNSMYIADPEQIRKEII